MEHTLSQNKAITITISSGKGGVGKTNITTNLGVVLAKAGKKVCIFDADTSLANINILLGLYPELTLEHFLKDDISINDIMLSVFENLKIIPSASGISELANLNNVQQQKLLVALEQLEQQFDYLLIDSAAGISSNVLDFIQSSQYAVIIISQEPTSLTDAFALIKKVQHRACDQPIYILVNMCNSYAHSVKIFKRFAHAVNNFINIKVRYLGYIPNDPAIKNAVNIQSPVTISAPNSPASRCLAMLANILIKHLTLSNSPNKSISQFWRSQLPPTPITTIDECNHELSDKELKAQQLLNLTNEYIEKYNMLPDAITNLLQNNCMNEHSYEPSIAQKSNKQKLNISNKVPDAKEPDNANIISEDYRILLQSIRFASMVGS